MSETNRARYLAKNLLLFGLASFGPKLLSFLLVPLYTHYLTTSDYGFADLLNTTANLIYPIVTIGISNAVLAYIINVHSKQRRVFPVTFGLLLTIAGDAFAVIVMVLIGLSESTPLNLEAACWLSALVMLDGLYAYMVGYMRGANHVGLLAISSIINSLVSLVSAIALIAFFGWGVNGYLAALCLGMAVSVLVSIIGSRLWNSLAFVSFKKKYNITVAKKMLAYSIPLVFSGIAWWLNSSADRYIVTFFCGIGANGIYSIAYMIPAIVAAFQGVFAQAWLLSAFEEAASSDSYKYFGHVYSMYALALSLVCAIIMLFNIPLAAFLYANEFFQAWEIAPMLVISAFFIALGSFGESIFQSKYNTAAIAWTMIAGAAINITASCILAPIAGPIGVAYSTLLGYFLTWISRVIILRHRYSCSLSIAKPLSSLAVFLCQYYLMTTFGFSILILIPGLLLFLVYNRELKDIVDLLSKTIERKRKSNTNGA